MKNLFFVKVTLHTTAVEIRKREERDGVVLRGAAPPPLLYFTLCTKHVRGAHAGKPAPRHRRTADRPPEKSHLWTSLCSLSLSLSRALTPSLAKKFFRSEELPPPKGAPTRARRAAIAALRAERKGGSRWTPMHWSVVGRCSTILFVGVFITRKGPVLFR